MKMGQPFPESSCLRLCSIPRLGSNSFILHRIEAMGRVCVCVEDARGCSAIRIGGLPENCRFNLPSSPTVAAPGLNFPKASQASHLSSLTQLLNAPRLSGGWLPVRPKCTLMNPGGLYSTIARNSPSLALLGSLFPHRNEARK